MADLLPSVQRSPALTEAPNSMVSAGDYSRLGAAWGGAFDSLKDVVDEISADYGKKTGEEEGFNSVQRDENGKITVKKMPFSGLVGPGAAAHENAFVAAQSARLQSWLGTKAQELAVKTWLPKEQGGGGGDPQWFSQQWKEVSIGVAQNGTGGEQLRLQQQAEEIGAPYMRRAMDQRASMDSEASTKTLLGHIDLLTDDATQLARSAYNGPEFKKAVDGISSAWATLAADPRSGVTPELVEQNMTRLRSMLAGEATLGAVERAYDPAKGGSAKAALDLADSFRTDPQFKDMPASKREQYRSAGRAYVKQQEGEKKAALAALAPEVERTIQNIRGGMIPAPADLDSLFGDLADAGGVRQTSALLYELNKADYTRSLASLPDAQVLALAEGRTSGGGSLMRSESGGRPDVVNGFGYAGLYQFGAPRLADLGIYTPGAGENLKSWSKTGKDAPGKWSGTFSIPGHPEVKTLDDFRASPAAQQAAYRVHAARMDEDIRKNGLDRFIGSTIGGALITREGIHNMMHLGGTQGAIRYLTSGGTDNPADANGTSLADYARMGAAGGGAVSTGSYVVDEALAAGGEDAAQSGRTPDYMYAALRENMKERIGAYLPRLIKAQIAFEVPDPDQLLALGGMIHYVGTPEQARDFASMVIKSKMTEAAGDMPQDQFQAFMANTINEIRASGDIEMKAMIPDFQEMAKKLVTAWKADPHSAGQMLGLDLPSLKAPLPFDRPDLMPTALQLRFKDNAKLEARAGYAPSLFTPSEIPRFGQIMRSGDANLIGGTLNSIAAMPPDAIKATLADNAVLSSISSLSNSAVKGRAALAYGFLSQVQQKMPLEFNHVFGQDTALDLAAWKGRLSQLTDDQFQKERILAADPAAQAARKMLDEQASKIISKSYDTPDKVAKLLDMRPMWDISSYFGSIAPMSDDVLNGGGQMMADYAKNFSDAYARTGGNESEAEDYATQQTALKWGASDANGGRLMVNPPERYLPQVLGSHDWIRQQLAAAVAQHFGVQQQPAAVTAGISLQPAAVTAGVGVLDDLALRPVVRQQQDVDARPIPNFVIVSDTKTDEDIGNGKPPSYHVIAQDAGGGWHLVEQSAGDPIRFVPDVKAAENSPEVQAEYRNQQEKLQSQVRDRNEFNRHLDAITGANQRPYQNN